MSVIWNYSLAMQPGVQEIEMDEEGETVHVGMLNGELCIWVEVNPDADKVKRYYAVVETGQAYDDKWWYIGTATDADYVWHIFGVARG